jgi:putative colanic acid biosynthesis UDP-glucose lipid carrier transferase
MIASNRVNYSKYIRPISILMDLLIISILGFYLFEYQIFNIRYYIIYLIIGWCVVAILINFYNVYRFTAPIEIISK